MYYEGIRILREKKPALSIIENVKNLTSKKFKAEFETVLKDLEDCGYNTYYQVLNAKNYGVPQNRERVFLVSIRKDLDNGLFKFPEGFDNGIRLKDVLEDVVDKKYYLKNDKVRILIDKLRETNQLQNIKICVDSTINDPKIRDISNCITARYDAGIQNQKQIGLLVVEPQINIIGKIEEWHQRGNIYSDNGVMGCLAATDYKTPKLVCEQETDCRVRKLTPKECFRLMGFEDKDIDSCILSGLSNTQLYKQAGNSIVVDVLFEIYKELYKAIPSLFDDLKLSSFFSGIGAFEKGLDRLYNYINN